jgi:hypothetical protein
MDVSVLDKMAAFIFMFGLCPSLILIWLGRRSSLVMWRHCKDKNRTVFCTWCDTLLYVPCVFFLYQPLGPIAHTCVSENSCCGPWFLAFPISPFLLTWTRLFYISALLWFWWLPSLPLTYATKLPLDLVNFSSILDITLQLRRWRQPVSLTY